MVADFNGGWMRAYNAEFGTELTHDLVQYWDALADLTHFEDIRAFWRWAQDHGGHSIFRHLDCYPDAVETLQRLAEQRNEIVVITAKPRWAVHDTFAWISDHRLPTREVHVRHDKHRVTCDVYLEDSPQQLRDISRARPEATVVRMVRPWNRPVPGVPDVGTWAEFADLVADLRA